MARRLQRRLRHLPPVARAADATRQRRAVLAVRRSGWFDEAWYREQAGEDCPPDADALEHYLTVGSEAGWQPHPLFDPAYYLAHSRTARRSVAEPFTEFVARGARRGDDPHPLFETAAYLEQVPDAAAHPGGAFGHYLMTGWRRGHWPSEALRGRPLPPPVHGEDPYLDVVRRASRAHAAVADFTDFARSSPTFDHEGAAAFVRRMRAHAATLTDPPLVSVIVPTRDRAAVLPRAIESVLSQTYRGLELLIVDDGSTDGTDAVVAGYDDERVRYLFQENAGVSRARNHGLERARGSVVAYLDSDNAWVPEFLETMVAFLDLEGVRAAYAGIELRTDDGVEYRGRPLHREALRERNYIDLNTVVHTRSLIDDVGSFDESLRRVVDWDLLIRIADATELAYAPFVGAHYDAGEERSDRITSVESIGYRHIVRHKHLVDLGAAPDPEPGRTSILLVAGDGDPDPVAWLRARLDDGVREPELVVVDNGCAPATALRLRALEAAERRVQVMRVPDPASVPVAIDLAAARASGDVLISADPVVRASGGDLERLAAAVRAGEADLAQPTLLEPSGRIRATGQRLAARGVPISIGTELFEGDPALGQDPARDAVHGYAFAVATEWFRRLGGLDPLFVRGGADLDLSLRLRAAGGTVGWVASCAVVVDPGRDYQRWVPSYSDQAGLRARHGATERATIAVGDRAGGLRVTGFRVAHRTNRPGPKLLAAVYERDTERPRPRRWAIKTTAPNVAERHQWGDWYFGLALARALTRLGEEVVVDCREAWYRPTAHLDDVVVALRGTRRYEPNPAHVNLTWAISHPERLSWDEVATVDHTFVASAVFAAKLRERWPDLPVDTLMQCTDPEIFHPEPDPALEHDVLFVGNSRGQLRTVVRDAVEAGLEPAVYGSGWEGLVPHRLVHGEHVPNDELRRHYASAGVVLNDHWEDMRRHGFVSNRIYDALACGATVVTDEIEGLPDAPEGRLLTYEGPQDLAAKVAQATAARRPDPQAWPQLSEHTFDARARVLQRTVEALDTAPSRVGDRVRD